MSELRRNSDTERNRGMLTVHKVDPHRKEYDFSVDNPIGRDRFERAVKAEVCSSGGHQKNDPVYGFYHYKRWLWLELPWICLDLYIDYGKLIDVTFGFNGYSYFSYKTEFELMMKLENIIDDARERKTHTGQTGSASPSASTRTVVIASKPDVGCPRSILPLANPRRGAPQGPATVPKMRGHETGQRGRLLRDLIPPRPQAFLLGSDRGLRKAHP